MNDDKHEHIINMDFASLYPRTMQDFSEEFRQEMIRIKRDETIDEILNDDGK